MDSILMLWRLLVTPTRGARGSDEGRRLTTGNSEKVGRERMDNKAEKGVKKQGGYGMRKEGFFYIKNL